jgi:hypothetical protein
MPASGQSTREGLLIRTSRSPSGPGTRTVVASLAMQRTVHAYRPPARSRVCAAVFPHGRMDG